MIRNALTQLLYRYRLIASISGDVIRVRLSDQ